MPRIALYGRPGAGKSTFATALCDEGRRAGVQVQRLKLAAPLYEVQALVYALAGRPLLESGAQDGLLLNVLGEAMRRINPEALTGPFAARVQQAEARFPNAVLICDDMRAPDVDALAGLGFRLVEVTAPEELRVRRKQQRADLAAGDDHHCTEAAISLEPWQRVHNAGSLAALREQAARMVREVLR
ncbi:hypothetical protein [Streptomyces longwoodensis]|uniref:hypothetical protein n=1 Tax=Streptomyces longwoodensis TaxID=68231 RepID=UPI0036E17C03